MRVVIQGRLGTFVYKGLLPGHRCYSVDQGLGKSITPCVASERCGPGRQGLKFAAVCIGHSREARQPHHRLCHATLWHHSGDAQGRHNTSAGGDRKAARDFLRGNNSRRTQPELGLPGAQSCAWTCHRHSAPVPTPPRLATPLSAAHSGRAVRSHLCLVVMEDLAE
jgi:hypothetical protein